MLRTVTTAIGHGQPQPRIDNCQPVAHQVISQLPPPKPAEASGHHRSMSGVTVLCVFTDSEGNYGNPLGVVDNSTVEPADRQRIAAQLLRN